MDYEININNEYKDIETIDEWGCAYLVDDINDDGVEYNYCKEDGTDYSAIYYNRYNKYMYTYYNTFIHYEIDFDDKNWESKLENAMKNALKYFQNMLDN